jgi:membrane protein
MAGPAAPTPPRETRRPLTALKVLWAAVLRFSAAHGMRHGAAVAFYATFSIAPLLVVVTGLLAGLLGQDGAQAALLDTLTRLLGARETRTLAELLALRAQADGPPVPGLGGPAASALALATTFVGATGVFVELRAALHGMQGRPEPEFDWRELVRVRLLSLAVVVGCGFLLAVAMLVQTATLVALRRLVEVWPAAAALLVTAETLLSWVVVTALFTIIMRWLPRQRMPHRDTLLGAALAAALFMLGRYAISLYIETTALQSALGAASSFAALLVWVYWSSQIFLLGTALAVELGQARRARGVGDELQAAAAAADVDDQAGGAA